MSSYFESATGGKFIKNKPAAPIFEIADLEKAPGYFPAGGAFGAGPAAPAVSLSASVTQPPPMAL